MSGYVYDILPAQQIGRIVWFGTVASDPQSFDEKIYVTIPEITPDTNFGPCFWQSRGSNLTWEFTTSYSPTRGEEMPHDVLPKRGDRCLVMFDNRRQPWVVAWWPYDS